MDLSNTITLSIVSHGHCILVENLIHQIDSIPSFEGVSVVVTLNLYDEVFSYDYKKTSRLKLIIIRNMTQLGYGANHNQAFKKCLTPWFAILNPDLSLHNDIFSQLIETASHSHVSLIVPRVVNYRGDQEDSIRWNLTPWSLIKRRLRITGESCLDDGKFRWFAGMFFIVNSADFLEISGFDEGIFLYGEDYDLCARMHLAGMTLLFQPDICVVHDARRTSRSSLKFLLMHVKSLLYIWLNSKVWRIAFKDLF